MVITKRQTLKIELLSIKNDSGSVRLSASVVNQDGFEKYLGEYNIFYSDTMEIYIDTDLSIDHAHSVKM